MRLTPKFYWRLDQIDELHAFPRELQRHMARQFYWTWLWRSAWGIGTLIAALGVLGLSVWFANLEPKTGLSAVFHFAGILLSMCILQINCLNAFARHLKKHQAQLDAAADPRHQAGLGS